MKKRTIEAWVCVFDTPDNESLDGKVAQMGERYMVFPKREDALKEIGKSSLEVVSCELTYSNQH